MFEKQGKFYADWRDVQGKRLRKSFTSKRAAMQFESDQKGIAHPKSKAQSQTSPNYFARRSSGQETVRAATSIKQRGFSSLKLVASRRKG